MVLLLFVELDPALGALRPLGGFFVLRTTVDPERAPLASSPTLAQAYESSRSDVYPISLTFRIRKVARSLRAPELRVAASIAQLGLAARLWSVTLACAALYERVPDLDPQLLRWDPDASAPDDLLLTEVRPRPADPATVADTVLRGHLAPLHSALRARVALADGLLWGNAASALAGAARELDRWARAHGRDDVAARSHALTRALFTHPPLAGTGTFRDTAFRRRSCCLYYRVPGGGLCGDCGLSRVPGRG
ncbi:(2Fe-2S)-binding protein [Streptomyces sp. NPDC093252]|uniref:(2Fe-2S)-binding protein n=1 Tax=Streptomyces sp. NPDC093252 TaxID=3154980 RepID=UPI00344A4A97